MNLLCEFTGSGRLGRRGFWLRHLLVLPLALGALAQLGPVLGEAFEVAGALLLVMHLFSVWRRRLHDRGRSGAWLLLALLPVVGVLALWVECGLRGPSVRAECYGQPAGVASDYLAVRSTP